MASDEEKGITKRNHHLTGGGGSEVDKIIGEAAKNLTNEQKSELAKYAIEKRIDLDADRAGRETKYTHARQQLSDHLDIVDSLQKNKSSPMSRNIVNTTVESGAGKTEIKSKDGATCFVATVAYGHPQHPNVVILRDWRDKHLSKSLAGNMFIAAYWKVGPVLAKTVSKSDSLRKFSRKLLDIVVSIVNQRLTNSK